MTADPADTPVEITVHASVGEIPAADWDACACPEVVDGGRPNDPFTTHRFLTALERSGSVGPGSGWQPQPLVARLGGRAVNRVSGAVLLLAAGLLALARPASRAP